MAPLILVVEDDDAVRQLILRSLNELGYETDSAVDAPSAIELLEKRNYHVVITDKNMPGTDHYGEGGMDVLEFLQKNKPATGALMVTAFASVETAVEAMKLGAFDYISKPFLIKDIRAKLARIIEYQQCIDPASAFNTYRCLHEEVLEFIKKNHRPINEERLEEVLSSFRKKLDLMFQEGRKRENLLLEQRDAMANMTAWTSQLKEILATGDIQTAEKLADQIIDEGNKRL